MDITVKSGDLQTFSTKVVILPIVKGNSDAIKKAYPPLFPIVDQVKSDYDICAEEGSFHLLYTQGKIKAEKLVLVGLGDLDKLTIEKIRKASGATQNFLKKKKCEEAAVLLPTYVVSLDTKKVFTAVCEGLLLSAYSYDMYKTAKEEKEKETKIKSLTLFCSEKEKFAVEQQLTETQNIAQSVYLVRDLINGPANVVTPTYLAAVAQNLAQQYKLKCKVFGVPELKKEKMNLILGVAQGSAEEPKFVVLEYKHKGAKKTIALVGKGVCFDSGGLQIKPGKAMADMKEDMAGAAITLGTIKAAAELQLPIHIIGCMPCVENMPGCKAQKPGDILVSASGKTVEIHHTDAEGRLILGDALHYATTTKPHLIIDLATLTGACVVALGTFAAGLFTSEKKLSDNMMQCGEDTHERVWPLPLFEEYSEMIKGDLADIKNIGSWDGDAGAITAAAFLKEFVGNTPWVHIDIAGVTMSGKDHAYTPKGATGYGVRLLVEFLKKYS